MSPRRTMVTVSKPRCGCCGKPGTTSPWYMRQPSLPAKSWPMSRPASDAAGPELLVARRVGVVVVHAEQERIGGLPGKAERRDREDRVRVSGSSGIGLHRAWPFLHLLRLRRAGRGGRAGCDQLQCLAASDPAHRRRPPAVYRRKACAPARGARQSSSPGRSGAKIAAVRGSRVVSENVPRIAVVGDDERISRALELPRNGEPPIDGDQLSRLAPAVVLPEVDSRRSGGGARVRAVATALEFQSTGWMPGPNTLSMITTSLSGKRAGLIRDR